MLKTIHAKTSVDILQLMVHKIVKICFQTSCFKHVGRTPSVITLYGSEVPTLYGSQRDHTQGSSRMLETRCLETFEQILTILCAISCNISTLVLAYKVFNMR
jgi:hypothetical protein